MGCTRMAAGPNRAASLASRPKGLCDLHDATTSSAVVMIAHDQCIQAECIPTDRSTQFNERVTEPLRLLLQTDPLKYPHTRMRRDESILIIGAGPAGLTAAYELSKHGYTGTILEADDVVGGIARTVE